MTKFTAADVRELRAYILDRKDASKVRITRNGEVRAYGTMPNTNKVGWYFVGFDTNLIEDMKWSKGQ